MPRKPRKPCKHPSCPKLTEENYCEEHRKLYANERASASSRGYDSRWRTTRSRFLKVNPLCVKCKEEDKLTRATVVDHIKPHRGDRILFWDESNWQALCKSCHDRKTRTQDQHPIYGY